MALSTKQVKQIVLLNKARNLGARITQATMAHAVGCSVATINRYSQPAPKAAAGTKTRTVTTVKTTVTTTSTNPSPTLFTRAPGQRGRGSVSADTRQRIVNLYKDGKTYAEIKSALGLSVMTIGKIVRTDRAQATTASLGGAVVPAKKGGRRVLPDNIRKWAVGLYTAGKTYQQIREETGISFATISRYVRQARDDGEIPA